MNLETEVNGHEFATGLCRGVGGMLPEPRNQEENDFLNSWQTDVFYLGMTDWKVEGSWVWDSDTTAVSWTIWRPPMEPDGGSSQNCNIMTRNLVPEQAEYWSSVKCMRETFKQLVICEKISKYINN